MYIRGLKKEIFYLIITLLIVGIAAISLLIVFVVRSSENDEKKAFRSEIKEVLDNVKDRCESDKLAGNAHISTYLINDYKISDIDVKYNTVKSGKLTVDSSCNITMRIYSENYMAYKHQNNFTFVNDIGYNKCTLESEELEIGSVMKCNNQKFYVIDYNINDITLLSMFNIDPSINMQDEDNNHLVAFDKFNNRRENVNTFCTSTIYGCNVYERVDGVLRNGDIEGTVKEDSSIKSAVDSYAMLVNPEGFISAGLIELSNLLELGCMVNDNSCLNSPYEWVYGTSYWTMTSYTGSNTLVYNVLNNGSLIGRHAVYDNYAGIRPVIKIKNETSN